MRNTFRILLVSGGLTLVFAAGCGEDPSTVTSPDFEFLETERLPELVDEFEATDPTGNAYRVVVRYDQSIAAKVAELPQQVSIISSREVALEKGYPEARFQADREQEQLPEHADLPRAQGAFHLSAYPIGAAPRPYGIAVKMNFSQAAPIANDADGAPGTAQAQATGFSGVCNGTPVGWGCISATSLTWDMDSYLQYAPFTSSNKGYIQARKDNDWICHTGTTSTINQAGYETTSSTVEYDYVFVYQTAQHMFFIDPDSSVSECMAGQFQANIWVP